MSKTNSPQSICPSCGVVGQVSFEDKKTKGRISVPKLVLGCCTFWLSVLIVGLRGKESHTYGHCDNCKAKWQQQ